MDNDEIKEVDEKPQATPTPSSKKGGWFQKIPREVLFSPGGVILVLLGLLMELGDIIPLPLIDQLWELPLEIIFMVLLIVITKPSIKSLIIPTILERIPVLSDILPTWLIKMFF